MTPQKPENKILRDIVYDASNYFDQWLTWLRIMTYDELRELIITDQLKRKVSPETKHHFIVVWNSIITPLDFRKIRLI